MADPDIPEGPADPDDGFGFEAPAPADPAAQVPSYIAVIRIIAVLGMGLAMSFGLFLMLVGLRGVLIGVPIFLLAVPFYFAMRLAERFALRDGPRGADGA